MGFAEKKQVTGLEEVYGALAGIGLTDAETRVYHASIALGTRPASIIAEKAGLKRSHTYNILASLKKKGIVQEVIKNGVRHFSCCSPTSLVGIIENEIGDLENKKRKLEHVLPKLQNMLGGLARQPKVRFYQGRQGIREIFEDILRSDIREMCTFTDLRYSWSTSDEEMRHWVRSFISRREEKDIWWRSVAVRSDFSTKELSRRSGLKRHIKALEGVNFPAEFIQYGRKVALLSTNGELIGVVVESEPITETFENLFGFMWNFLPDYEEPALTQS
jgi:sugar-specific transcriptional regulator TrmB